MKLTTGTGIFCPYCNKEVQITTSGLLGGIFKQLFLGKIVDNFKQKGCAVIGECGHTFEYRSLGPA